MKSRLLLIGLVVILTVGVIANGYFYYRESGLLSDAQSHIAALESNAAVLAGDIATLNGTAAGLARGISALADDASGLRRDIAAFAGNVSSQAADIAGVRTDISGLRSETAALSANISALSNNIRGLQDTVTGNSRAFQTYASAAQDTAMKLAPVMVRIDVTGVGFQGAGSGTIIDRRGYILTAQHVVASAVSINVTTMDGRRYTGVVVGADAELDLALVKISTDSDLPAAVFGTPADVIVGRDVMAIGYALGPDFAGSATVTRGIISATRTFQGSRYIQTDAAINPGNSGGALVTFDGKMIGVPSARIQSPDVLVQLIGLAIPIDQVLDFLKPEDTAVEKEEDYAG